MSSRLIIDGNAVYEIDEDCLETQKKSGGSGRFGRNSSEGTVGRGQRKQEAGASGSRD